MKVEQARSLAEELLAASLPQRWAHTQGVARRARELAEQLDVDAELLEAAAWLHDIGYSPGLVETEFHAFDGARYLRDAHHARRDLCVLVAHHSGAAYEAEERDLLPQFIAEFGGNPDTTISRALTACDMTTSPRGDRETPDRRIAEILARYESDSAVHRAVSRSGNYLVRVTRDLDSSD